MSLDRQTLDDLEDCALRALVKSASEGNAAAAASSLSAIERARKTQAASLHEATMATKSGPDLAAYLATLGCGPAETARRIGRKLTADETAAHEQAADDRLLEVRAVELSRMRRGETEPATWMKTKLTEAKKCRRP